MESKRTAKVSFSQRAIGVGLRIAKPAARRLVPEAVDSDTVN
ncbi:hypothetical protein [Arthrobacter methylotrophus]|uniref:Uncharacterized protein n=1 Tax=Arthrobacter methylotrophus TaxID=121291 RepID=A0ABV5UUB5_9MICC